MMTVEIHIVVHVMIVGVNQLVIGRIVDVFQWMKESWTQTKDEMGMKAGSKMNMDAIEVSKFNSEGKITDHWSFISMNDVMKMMQMPQGNMSMDTSKMKMDTTKH